MTNVASIDQAITTVSIAVEALCLLSFVIKRAYKTFVILTCYLAYLVVSDLVGLTVFTIGSESAYRVTYFTSAVIVYCMELGVIWELADLTLTPIKASFAPYLKKGALVLLCLFIIAASIMSSVVSYRDISTAVRVYFQFDLAFSVFRVLSFITIAACIQGLGIGFNNRCSQVVACLSLYSVFALTAQIAHEIAATLPWQYANFETIERMRTSGWCVTLLYLGWLATGGQRSRARSAGMIKAQRYDVLPVEPHVVK